MLNYVNNICKLCIYSDLGLGVSPGFLRGWCLTKVDAFCHEIQAIGWPWLNDSCVFNVTLYLVGLVTCNLNMAFR